MHTYLSKKIAIPNNTKINCICWHKTEGYIAVGGEDGLLKILKLDTGTSTVGGENETNTSAGQRGNNPSNLSMNVTLEGHKEPVRVIIWNEVMNKLTSSDDQGVIIVWMLYKGVWYEEMINRRNKSTVTEMIWTVDGSKICIAYEDGAVIVGAANGNRMWGKELKGVALTGVQWSPDGNQLLFTINSSLLHLYDSQGNFMMNFDVVGRSVHIPDDEIVTVSWYNGKCGYIGFNAPSLLVCFKSGRVVLLRGTSNDNPVLFDINREIKFGVWNHNGSILAFGCEQKNMRVSNEKTFVEFYNNTGKFVKSLRLPGQNISHCSWDGTGTKLAVTVDANIFFANVHLDYLWCYFKKTLVYTNEIWTNNGICVTFLDTQSNFVNTIYVKRLHSLAAYNEICVLGTEIEIASSGENYVLYLCDTGGTILDEKYLEFVPLYVTINSVFVVAASKSYFTLWQYNNLRNIQMKIRKRDYIYHIDDIITGEETLNASATSSTKFSAGRSQNDGDIECISCSEIVLLIGRKRGEINHYELPHMSLSNRHKLFANPSTSTQFISINCNSTKAAVIYDGQLIVFSIKSERESTSSEGERLNERVERKDVWSFCWATDNPHMFAIKEKTRLYVFRGTSPEEPISCDGYICSFQDLEIKTVLVDKAVRQQKALDNVILKVEVKSLRDTRELLNKVGINEARQFVLDNSHPRLWNLLAEAAMKKMDLVTAEVAFVYCKNLAGIEFINKLKQSRNQNLIKAEIAIYTKSYDEAERIYLEADRKDLLLELYKKLGNWLKLRHVLTSMSADLVNVRDIYTDIGQYYADRYKWANAKEYYEKTQNFNELMYCYYYLEDYESLEKLADNLVKTNPLVEKIGDLLASVGLCASAVKTYVMYGKVEKALKLCTELNEWELALNLAKEHSVPNIDEILNKYVVKLVNDNRLPQAIEVYQKANKFVDAGLLVLDYAKKLSKTETNVFKLKKWFSLAAMLMEKYTNYDKIKHNDVIKNKWKHAIAYQLLFIVQSSFMKGETRRAFVACSKLSEFNDIISDEMVYSLLVLTSRAAECNAMCSKGFVKLLSLDSLTDEEKDRYDKLAFEIFKKQPPIDKQIIRKECVNCETMIPDYSSICPNCSARFPICMVTGQPLMDPKYIWTCLYCNESADSREMVDRSQCGLCNRPKNKPIK